ncbi:hypothetical protein EV383_1835 [Pseudonocardia sediminis]|uniref:Uncharacterized protein n=1 Tax=Pseudonocardia sediminis TaxID=1397368 RepID=A0A4Q7UVA8_PSEST|nr:DUF5995 family protein [Pseudonocardia sediminis]RZT84974.1 hypothetical protein EV383_1835 [Pseudonocardia sediminis]
MAHDLSDFDDVSSLQDVVDVLTVIRDRSAADIERPQRDGISCFSRLYRLITINVLETVAGEKDRTFRDPDFLTLLDLEFARRYLAAIRSYEGRDLNPPTCWNVLFDRRRDDVEHANFAAAGVNAHVNFDLAFALLETWKTYPPTPDRRADYDQVNEIFAEEMDLLREDFDAFLADGDDGGPVDTFGNRASNLLVRVTRNLAWKAAERVWEHYDPDLDGGGPAYREAYDEEHERLDETAHLLGWMILMAPRLP